jgi:D-alanine-D-alanine ligase
MKKLRVLVLFGGKSAEHEISLLSAANILRHLDRRRYVALPVFIDRRGRWHLQNRTTLLHGFEAKPVAGDAREVLPNMERGLVSLRRRRAPLGVDVVFPVLHGPFGEDGTVQGLLEMADVPYVGCGVLASAVGMDKDMAYRLAAQAGIPLLPYLTILRGGWKRAPAGVRRCAAKLGFPVFVKPARLGSSVGVSKVEGPEGLPRAMEVAFLYDDKVILEKGINAREIECAALGSEEGVEVSVPGEIVTSPRHAFYTYQAKYLDPEGATLRVPAPLMRAQTKTVRGLAARAFQVLDGHGLARVDFLMDKKTGRFYFGEINTFPGFTAYSLYPKLWAASGLPLPRLLDRLIALALERHRRKRALRIKP